MQSHYDYQTVYREEVCSLAAARRVAAMLDLDPNALVSGMPLPRGWHFPMMAADTRKRDLREDGFPGLGVSLPNFGLPRLVLGGRRVEYRADLPIGTKVDRRSAITAVNEKASRTGGRLVAVDVTHELSVAGQSVLLETQAFLFMPAAEARTPVQYVDRPTPMGAEHLKSVSTDELLLFQFSALGFNTHLIHLDKSYASEIEGYPNLVVNGGLTTLLLTEFARNELKLTLQNFQMKNVTPLFCGRQITLAANRNGKHWSLSAYDDTGAIAATMEAQVDEL